MKKYNFISWNVNGIRAIDRKEALKWIDEIDVDFLALQEIKAKKEQIPSDLFDKKFENIFVNSASTAGRHGVALFCNIMPYFTSNGWNIDRLKEGRINEIHFKTNSYDVAFFNIYFPNGQMSEDRLSYKMEFYEKLFEYLKELQKQGKSIIICGDFNIAHKPIDLKRPKANENVSGFLPKERALLDKFIDMGFIDTFRYFHPTLEHKYTWWSYKFNARKTNAGWRIDYFFVSENLKENLLDAKILDSIYGSDHCPISLSINL